MGRMGVGTFASYDPPPSPHPIPTQITQPNTVFYLISPVDFKSNPEMSCLNRQDKALDRKFSALYDGISCQFVGVEQFSQSKKL